MKKAIASFLSKLYEKIVLFSQDSYRKTPGKIRKAGARVISVGNITWGGTGKTPLVAALARHAADMGKKVAVLTRGYGKDEVEELKAALPGVPIVVGRDRIKSAREAVEKHGAEILILDDGFQHIRLHRDLDIVNINATLPFGPGGLIPLGTLREPLENLSRADIFVLTKSDIGSKNLHWIRQRLGQLKANAVIFEAVHKPVGMKDLKSGGPLQLSELRGKRLATITGIGDPYSFEKTVEKLGAQILLAARFDDHHAYSAGELKEFVKRCAELQVREIVTTQKDFYRLEPILRANGASGLGDVRFMVLQMEFQVNEEEDFIRRCFNP
jgi:tetraacyldisaccharide 4'-kinase